VDLGVWGRPKLRLRPRDDTGQGEQRAGFALGKPKTRLRSSGSDALRYLGLGAEANLSMKSRRAFQGSGFAAGPSMVNSMTMSSFSE
jgi:hypothetical protein